jgi:TatD DNase family protein
MSSAKYSRHDSYEHWIDAHCHLCSEPLAGNLSKEIALAGERSINTFISTALTRKEVDWHLDNSAPEIKLVAGVHPFYDKSDSNDISFFADLCSNNSLWGVGEVGFDNRKNNHKFQEKILAEQLEIAQEYDLPVVFHVVKRYNELYQLLNNSFPKIRGFIHGFTGSPELVEMLTRLNIGFSLGHRILQQKDAKDTIVRIIKHGLFLFETDAPFLPQHNKSSQDRGMLSSLHSIISAISEMTGIKTVELLDGQWSTFRALSKP